MTEPTCRRNLLILAYYYPPENASGAARPARLARYLPEAGFDCFVVARGRQRPEDGPERVYYVDEGQGPPVQEWFCRMAQRYLLPLNERLPWVPAALARAEALVRQHRVDAILSTSPPLGAHLAALALHRRTGIPWIADFRDPLANNPFRRRRFFNYDLWLERRIFARASLILANTDSLASQWKQTHPGLAGRVRVLWNGFDPEAAIPEAPARRDGPHTILHAGSLYGGRRPNAFVSALAALARAGHLDARRWQAVLLGPVEDSTFRDCEADRAYLEQAGLLRVDARLAHRDEAAAAQATASVLLLLDIHDQPDSIQVPGKLFDYVRTGHPILAWTSTHSPTHRLLEKCGLDTLCLAPDLPAAAVAARLREFLERPLTRRPMSDWFTETFDGRRQAHSLADELEKLLGGRRFAGRDAGSTP